MTFPLKNKLFVSTRPKGQSDELNRLLQDAGAKSVEMPLIKIKQAQLTDADKTLFYQLEQFQWLIFTSPNGIYSFFKILKETGIYTLPKTIQIAVIGNKTEETLTPFGYSAAFVNPGNTSEDFAAAFIQEIKNINPKPRILMAVGNLARTNIQDKLSKYAHCSRLDVYKTIAPKSVDKNILQLIRNNQYEMLIFTSPSAIQNFMKLKTNFSVENIRMACIGAITANEAIIQGIQPLVIAKDASARGIVEAIIQFYIKNSKKL